jgi:hypothetical protein
MNRKDKEVFIIISVPVIVIFPCFHATLLRLSNHFELNPNTAILGGTVGAALAVVRHGS